MTPMPAAMVPKPVPEAVANSAEAPKATMRKGVAPTPALAARPAMAPARPEARSRAEKTPANSQHTTGAMASRLAMPPTSASV